MQYRILQIVSFFLFLGMPMYAQNQRLIFGTVYDETTSETIIGAVFLIKNRERERLRITMGVIHFGYLLIVTLRYSKFLIWGMLVNA